MSYFDLLLDKAGETDLDSVARSFFAAAHVGDYVERESVHYVEDRYYKGALAGVTFKVMLSDDEDHSDLRFCVNIELVDEAVPAFDVDSFVRTQLIPAGFKVARLVNFGRTDERRLDF